MFVLDAEIQKEFAAIIFPVFKPFQIRAGFAEEFKFHLLEFARSENKVAGGNFVSERFSYLRYAERQFSARRALYVRKVDKNALRRFGTEIHGRSRVFRDADKGLEHKVEFFYVGKFVSAALGASDTLFFDKRGHFFKRPARGVVVRTVFIGVIFYKFVGAVARFAPLAVHKGIGKAAHVSGRHPDIRVYDNSGIKSHVVFAFLNETFPPGFFYVVFKFHAKRTVIPTVGKPPVNFASGEDKAPAFAKIDYFFHSRFLFHSLHLLDKNIL